jgi:16S rRNA (cytidine1402-2'-O)-methyltransferase
MPGVSDPGARLVEAARTAGASVEVVPGPSAVTAAVSAAGVESIGFLFGGFLPPRPAAARETALRRLLDASGSIGMPLVLFEAPPRIDALLAALEREVPEARLAVCRELTKLHEEVLVGTPSEVRAARSEARGELTLVISRVPRPEMRAGLDASALVDAAARAGLSPRTIVELLRAAGVRRREAYRAAQSSASVSEG